MQKLAWLASIKALLVFCIVLPLAGCAFGNRTVSLSYTPASEKHATPAITDPVGVTKFQDARSDKKCIGEVRNGMMMKTAEVISAEEDLGNWISNAFLGECKARGYKAEATDLAAAGTQGYVIGGSVLEVYSRVGGLGPHSRVRLNVVVTQKGVTVLSKEYSGQYTPVSTMGSSKAYQKFFDKALGRALDKFFTDFETQDKEPKGKQ